MPTGYTAEISEGITFQQYAMNCARAFGALIMMRDEPSNAPIPEEFKPSDYNRRELDEQRARLAEIDAMTPEQATAAATKAHNAAMTERKRRFDDVQELRRKYQDMLNKVNGWEPPSSDHEELKTFMASQIRQSIDFDCKIYGEVPQQLTGPEWLAEQRALCLRMIEFHEAENKKEIERTENRNKWVADLRKSLNC